MRLPLTGRRATETVLHDLTQMHAELNELITNFLAQQP